MSHCPTCNSSNVRLVDEQIFKNFFICDNPGCQQYGKKFSKRTIVGKAGGIATTLTLGIILGDMIGEDGGGGEEI